MRASLSLMTVPNQPANIVATMMSPADMTMGPMFAWLSHIAAPPTVMNSAIEPITGQGLPCGM